MTIEQVRTPRTKDGAQYYPLGEEAYAVIFDLQGEVSEQHPGEFYVAMSPTGGVRVLFHCRIGGRHTVFHINRRTVGGSDLGIYVDGQMVHRVAGGWHLYAGDTVSMDWGSMYDQMA